MNRRSFIRNAAGLLVVTPIETKAVITLESATFDTHGWNASVNGSLVVISGSVNPFFNGKFRLINGELIRLYE